MNTGLSDAEHEKERQREQWDLVAAGWEKWWRTIEDGAQHLNDRLVDLAEVTPGKRVLFTMYATLRGYEQGNRTAVPRGPSRPGARAR